MAVDDTVQCPDCGSVMPDAARFCPGCGRPRSHVEHELRQRAFVTGVPYDTLLERARGDVQAQEPAGWNVPPVPERGGSEGVVILTLLAMLVGVVLWASGAGIAVVLALLIVLAGVYVALRNRMQRAEARVLQLEHQIWELTASTRVAPAPRAASPTPASPVSAVPSEQPQPVVVAPPAADVPRPLPVPEPPPEVPLRPERAAPELGVPTIRPQPRPAWSASDLEQLLSGRVLAWVGGLAVLLGALFFLSLAFSRDWIGPGMRVVIGIVASVALLAGGAWFFERRERLFGHVLLALGLAIMSISLFAATNFYDLVAIEVALVGAMASAIVAAVVAIRSDSQVVAAYGLLAVLAAPPILGASASASVILFLATALTGTTIIALYRDWRWLPPLAFLMTAPQLADWILSDAPRSWGLVALAGFWLVHALAAGGEEYRLRSNRLQSTSATLLVANAAFLIGSGFALLDGDATGWRGLFLVVVALAHGAIGGYFLARDGERSPFGLLAFGTGIAALSMAVPVQFGGPVVPVAWAAEAAALAWVYARRNHVFSGGAALVMLAASLAHLVTIEYPFWQIDDIADPARPFLNGNAGTLGFILLAMAVSGALVARRDIRVGLTSLGLSLVIYALPFELSGIWLMAGWSVVFVLATAIYLRHDHLPRWATAELQLFAANARPLLLVPAFVSGLAAGFHALGFELPLDSLISWTHPDIPFVSLQTAAAAILIAALLLVALAATTRFDRSLPVVAAFAVAAYLMPFELRPAAMVVAWSVLALAMFALARVELLEGDIPQIGAWLLTSIAIAVVLLDIAPPDRLLVQDASGPFPTPFWNGATAALLALVILLAAVRVLHRTTTWSRWLAAAASVFGIYLLSVGVVDVFQSRVDGTASVDSLRKQSQVALSILWTVIGVSAFIGGIMQRSTIARVFGLALLGVSTVKVFVYDMASLDASYRVLSFIGLGLLLLISAYAYQRLMPALGSEERAR